MTRTYAARQLLALGPLSFGQFTEITGWPAAVCRRVLSYLVDDLGEASRFGRVYRMTHEAQLSYLPELATKKESSNGTASTCELRSGAAMDVLPTVAPVREAISSDASTGRCACGLGK